MPLPIRVPSTEVHHIEGISPLEGTLLIVGIFITAMALVWYFTRNKRQNP